jgi:serine/threonine protein kinase
METTIGRYDYNKKPIGSGSYSRVYLGTNKDTNDKVAVKKISLDQIKMSVLSKLKNELGLVVKLNHPNIVKSHEIITTEHYWYIIMEYCNRGTLLDVYQYLKKNSQLSDTQREELTKYYLNQLKDALLYLKNNDIVHRDIKPMNILVTEDTSQKLYSKDIDYSVASGLKIRLADFGFARVLDSDMDDFMIKTICGSPIYMGPEILFNKEYNSKADLWSFGIIMYEMLYGFNPYYKPQNTIELCNRIKSNKIDYFESKKNFSSQCFNLVKRLLSTDPDARIEWRDFFSHQWWNESNNLSATNNDKVNEKLIFSSMSPANETINNRNHNNNPQKISLLTKQIREMKNTSFESGQTLDTNQKSDSDSSHTNLQHVPSLKSMKSTNLRKSHSFTSKDSIRGSNLKLSIVASELDALSGDEDMYTKQKSSRGTLCTTQNPLMNEQNMELNENESCPDSSRSFDLSYNSNYFANNEPDNDEEQCREQCVEQCGEQCGEQCREQCVEQCGEQYREQCREQCVEQIPIQENGFTVSQIDEYLFIDDKDNENQRVRKVSDTNDSNKKIIRKNKSKSNITSSVYASALNYITQPLIYLSQSISNYLN